MAKIRFYVRSKRLQQPATLYCRFSDTRVTDIWTPTHQKVYPEFWSNKTQSFKQRILFNNVFSEEKKTEIETSLTRLKESILKDIPKDRQPSKEWLKESIDRFYNQKSPGDENLNQFIQRFIDDAKSGQRLYKSKRYGSLTIKNYLGLQVQLNEFQGIYSEDRKKELEKKGETPRPLKILNFNDITQDFYNDLLRYFNDKNYKPNTIGRHIKQIKVIMRQSQNEGLHNNTQYENDSFAGITEKVDNIYLSEAELIKMFDLDLSDNQQLDITRDVFLVGCYTAQRFSDYSRIRKSDIREIKGVRVIELIQAKTHQKVIIPIRPELEFILKKYDYNLPRTYEQKINERIKTVGEKAGITDTVNYEETKGGMTAPKTARKCDLIRTHTARRSGCTNMYLAKIAPINIMKISGHESEKEFLKYIKIGKEETAVILSDHAYFKGNVLSVAK